MKRLRQRRENGATIVEAAFAIPIFFFLVLGLVDFGVAGLNDNQAGNAARDGARAGIINYKDLDDTSSADYQAVVDAIEKNLPGREIGVDTVVLVECVDPDDNPVACLTARVDFDRVHVRVSWDHETASPVAQGLGFSTINVDGDSTAVIIGSPIPGGGPSPAPCLPVSVSVTPDPVLRNPDSTLQSNLTVNVVGTGSCPLMSVTLVDANGTSREICSSNCLGETQYLAGSDTWALGTARADVDVNSTLITTTDFEVEDPAPPPCNVTGVTVSNDPAYRFPSGPQAGELIANQNMQIQRTGVCTNLVVSLTAPNGSVASPINCGACTGTVGYPAGANSFWTVGTAQIAVSGDDSFSRTFQVADPCASTTTITPPSAASNKQYQELTTPLNIAVSAPGSLCSSLTVRVVSPTGFTFNFPSCTNVANTCSITGFIGRDPSNKPWPTGLARVEVVDNTSGVVTSTSFQVTAAP